jgi:3-deoxy-D-manno-octulosonic-acid transferase
VLRTFDTICAQGRQDAERYVAIGADPARVVVTGSAKYDVALQSPGDPVKGRAILAQAGVPESALVLLGGSTWAGEEDILLDLYRRCKTTHPALVLVLVPRHAERRDDVMAAIRSRGLSLVQRSATGATAAPAVMPDVLLVDTTGELRHVYTVGDVVFVGKSLTQHGGQNVIEPAACGKAIVVGPNMENFPDVVRDFREADAIVQVSDAAQFGIEVERLLGDGDRRGGYGTRARALVDARRGGIQRMIEAVDGK